MLVVGLYLGKVGVRRELQVEVGREAVAHVETHFPHPIGDLLVTGSGFIKGLRVTPATESIRGDIDRLALLLHPSKMIFRICDGLANAELPRSGEIAGCTSRSFLREMLRSIDAPMTTRPSIA